MQIEKELFQTTPPSPFQGSDNCLGIHYHRAAIAAWDTLVSGGYQPATIINSDIYMRRSDFINLIEDLGGKCSTKEDKSNRISSVWINVLEQDLMIQIVYKERLNLDHGIWNSASDWKPLR